MKNTSLYNSLLKNSQTLLSPNELYLIKLLGDFVHKDTKDELCIVILLLFFQETQGSLSLYLEKKSLIELWKSYLETIDHIETNKDQQLTISQELFANLENKEFLWLNFSNIISQGEKFCPLVLLEDSNGLYLYTQKNFKSYTYIQEKKIKLLNNIKTKSTTDLKKSIDHIYTKYPVKKNSQNILYHPLQKKAVFTGLSLGFSIITGGPGTGKTSVILNIIRGLLKQNYNIFDIAICAPTGRAAGRLLESILEGIENIECNPIDDQVKNIKTSTIHKLLGHDPYLDRWKYNEKNPLPFLTLIVDESSMIDLNLMSRLMEAVSVNTNLILVGDKNQLPAIEVGNLLSDFLRYPQKIKHNDWQKQFHTLFPEFDTKDNEDHSYITELTKSHRSVGSILQPATMICQGESPDTLIKLSIFDYHEKSDSNGLFMIEPESNFQEHLNHQLQHYGKILLSESYIELLKEFKQSKSNKDDCLRSITKHLERMRILCLVNEGVSGQIQINDYFIQELYSLYPSKYKLPSGTPIIITTNSPDLGLYNGDIGVLLLDENDVPKIYFLNSNTNISFFPEQIKNMNIAFAHTVHKSQGSEYNEILLILPEKKRHNLYCRELLYTAITRAKTRAVIFGHKESIDYMIAHPLQRNSGPLAQK